VKRSCRYIGVVSLVLILFVMPTLAAAQVSLEVWNDFNPATSIDARALVEAYREYERLNPGVKINHNTMTYADLRQKAVVANQAGTGPDVLHMLGEWVAEFSALGIIEDITDLVENWEDKDQFPASTWAVATSQGRIYGIPSIASTRALVYRNDLFEEVGIAEPPVTWSDLRDVAKKLAVDRDGDGRADVAGFAFCSSTDAVRGPQEFLVLLWSTGAELAVQTDGKWVPGFTVDQVRDVYQLLYDMMHVDKSVPEYIRGWEYNDLDQAFEVGTVAMCQNGAWMANRATRSATGEHWRTAAVPYQKVPATYMEVKVEAIGAHSANKAEAWNLLSYLMSKDQMYSFTKYDNLPSRSDVMALPYYQENEIWCKTFLELVPHGKVIPSIPLSQVFLSSMEYLQAVLYKLATPEQAAQGFYDDTAAYLSTLR